MNIIKMLSPIAEIISMLKYKKDRLRLQKLISNGLKVGKNVYIMENVEFDLNYPYLIEIGDNCRISKDVRILSHDATTFRELGVTRLAPVRILEGTFIGERAVILPGVTLGPHALIAAGSVVNRDIGEDRAAAGNPARPYGNYSELVEKYRETAGSSNIFKKEEIENGLIDIESISKEVFENEIAFIRGVPKSDPYYVNTDMDQLRETSLEAYENLIHGKKND